MKRKQIHPLRSFRETHRLSQAEAAKQFGVSQITWSRLERGLHRPRRALALQLIRKTGVSVEVLMGLAS